MNLVAVCRLASSSYRKLGGTAGIGIDLRFAGIKKMAEPRAARVGSRRRRPEESGRAIVEDNARGSGARFKFSACFAFPSSALVCLLACPKFACPAFPCSRPAATRPPWPSHRLTPSRLRRTRPGVCWKHKAHGVNQFSTRRPGTRPKSRRFLDNRVAACTSAMDAILRS
jgi:hypothetical protein